MDYSRRDYLRILLTPSILVLPGCINNDEKEPGSLTLRNNSRNPQIITVSPEEAPAGIGSVDENLYSSTVLEPDEEKYYPNFIQSPGDYNFSASISNGDSTQTGTFTHIEDGREYRITFEIDPNGDVTWELDW